MSYFFCNMHHCGTSLPSPGFCVSVTVTVSGCGVLGASVGCCHKELLPCNSVTAGIPAEAASFSDTTSTFAWKNISLVSLHLLYYTAIYAGKFCANM